MQYLRGKAVVLFAHNGKFLFTKCTEQTTGRTFYIPVGGGIGFGEYSRQAAVREVREETGEEVEDLVLLHVSENIFIYNGREEHGIAFVYSGTFKNKKAYTTALQAGFTGTGKRIELVWKSGEDIESEKAVFYPSSLQTVLK